MVFVILLTITFVSAATDTDINSGNAGTGNSCEDGNCWPTVSESKGKSNRGMRVTLMKTSGESIGKASNIFVWEGFRDLLKSKSHYYFGDGSCNKVQYLKGTCRLETKKWDRTGQTPYNIITTSDEIVNGKTLESLFNEFNVSVRNNLAGSWQIDEIWNALKSQENQNKKDEMELLIKTLFSLTDDELNSALSQSNDLWILVEPLTIVSMDYNLYLGTHHELQSVKGVDDLGSLRTVIRKALPCSAYATGTMINSNYPGVNVVNKTYFDGTLKAVDVKNPADAIGNRNFETICTRDKGVLNESYVTGDYATGIGIVKFSDLVNRDITCNDVKNNAKDGDLEFNLEKYYKIGGIDEIKKYYPTIKYKDENGNIKDVNTEWYVNECTCYGVYDFYQNETGVDLTTTLSNNIKTIFNDRKSQFENFVNDLKTNLNTVSNELFGKVTPWTYDKYEKLQCDNGDFICESVSFDFTEQELLEKCDELPGIDAKACRDNVTKENLNKCSNLKLYPDHEFDKSYVESNNSSFAMCFEFYNLYHGTNIDVDDYLDDGCAIDKQPVNNAPINCTPDYRIGTCLSREYIYYKDQNNLSEDVFWDKCVFGNLSSKEQVTYNTKVHKYPERDDVTNATIDAYKDLNLSGDYCEIYCIESVSTSFLNSIEDPITSGSLFRWDGHQVVGSRTCKTKSIDYNKFKIDIENANEEIAQKYANWQVLLKKQEEIEKTPLTSKNYNATNDETTCTYKVNVNKVSFTVKYSTVFTKTKEESVSDYKVTYSGNKSCSQTPSLPANSPLKKSIASAEKEYKEALEYAESLIKEMEKCYAEDIWDDNLYNVNPNAKLIYSDGVYSYEGQLETNTKYTSIAKTESCATSTTPENIITSCNGDTCTNTSYNMKKCTEVTMSITATTDFNVESGVFQYIDKFNNISFNGNGISGTTQYKGNTDLSFAAISSKYTGSVFNYIDNVYSSLPVAFSTKSGFYGEGHLNGKLSLIYSNLGHVANTNYRTSVDWILDTEDPDKYNNWLCEYEVIDGPITDEDYNIIFRPIDLSNPFPDIDAQGRDTGSNWCNEIDCSNDNAIVKKYITNNRGVSADELYQLTPMYSFTLTPAAIMEIRKYNDNYDYGSHNRFVCEKGTGKTCISGYLTDLIKNYSSPLSGTCMDDKYRQSTDSASFDACQLIK